MLVTLLLCACPQTAAIPDSAAIRIEDYRPKVEYFASDELEGRESGREGGRKAAQYSAGAFQRLGLQPLGEDGSYLLPFALPRTDGLVGYNAAGLLPGTDPDRADEILVIGGHHDHAGIGGPGSLGSPGQIHNGADDNASGSCGVLELAEYFSRHPTSRPILFVTFTGEERGLLGSQDFVHNGPVPVEKMRAMINLDMIGRSVNGYVFVGGMGTAQEFHELLDGPFQASGLDVETAEPGEAPSDNTPFFQAGVPCLFFFTNIHDDYHMPTDDVEKINFPGAIRILQLVRDAAVAINDMPGALHYENRRGQAMPSDFEERMMNHYRHVRDLAARRGRLGITPGGAAAEGIILDRIRDGSAAQRAGLRAGDILVSVDGRETPDTRALRRALAGKLRGAPVTLQVLRGKQGLVFQVTLD